MAIRKSKSTRKDHAMSYGNTKSMFLKNPILWYEAIRCIGERSRAAGGVTQVVRGELEAATRG